MTSKLKCPFCQHKLYQTASEPATYCCLYKDCASDFKFAGSKELWQALIQAKQGLEQYERKDNLQQQLNANNNQIQENYKQIVEIDEQIIENLEKDLEIARKALEEIKENYEERFKAERDGFTVNWDIVAAFYARTIVANAIEQIGITTETKGKKNEQQTSNQKQ